MVSSLSTLASALLLAASVHSYAKPGACSGICNNAHDPSLIVNEDGTYIRYATGSKIATHTAPDITGPWVYKGAAIPSGSRINLKGNDDLWAPDVHKIGDTYYLYYAVSSFGSQNSAIGVATSSDGLNWEDHGATGIASNDNKNYNAIDPNLFVHGDTNLMNYGSFWSDIYQGNMDSLTRASGRSRQTVFQPSGNHGVEGSYLYQNGEYYYLFYSAGQCCNLDTDRPPKGQEYKIMVCRASSPTGPFVDKSGQSCTNGGGTLVLPSHGYVYAPGGQGVYNDSKYGPVLYYHHVDTRIGYADGQKVLGWNKIDFSSGWPVV